MDGKIGEQVKKRNVAFKLRIGQILQGKQNFEEEKLRNIEINGKNVVRVNLIANVVDKYAQEGEKKFGSLTLDDATGQINLKFFGEDVSKLENYEQGDTILVVGLLRWWSNEVYITPEIIKKKDPKFLLVRKLESELDMPKEIDKTKIAELKEKILSMIKAAESSGGVDVEKVILELKEP